MLFCSHRCMQNKKTMDNNIHLLKFQQLNQRCTTRENYVNFQTYQHRPVHKEYVWVSISIKMLEDERSDILNLCVNLLSVIICIDLEIRLC